MSEPFAQPSDYRKVMREAKIGALVLVMLIGFFIYVVYYRVERFKSQLPQYVLDAPVATVVEPHDYFRSLETNDQNFPAQKASTPPKAAPLKAVPQTAVKPLPNTERKRIKREPAKPQKRLSIYQNELRVQEPDSKVVMASATAPIEPKVSVAKNHIVSQLAAPLIKKTIPLPIVEKPYRIESNKRQVAQEPVVPLVDHQTENSSDNAFQPIAVKQPVPDDFTKLKTPEVVDVQAKSSQQDDDSSFVAEFEALQPTTDQPPQPASGVVAGSSNNDFADSYDAASKLSGTPIPELFVEDPIVESPAKNQPADVESQPVFTEANVSTEARAVKFVSTSQKTDPLKTYTVRSGDSYWAIAQTVYGDGRFFRALFEHNRTQQGNFESLEPGTKLSTPTPDILLIKYPELCPSEFKKEHKRAVINMAESPANELAESVYQTIEGDTLFDIARSKLGQASRYLEILELNRDILPKNITHMAVLKTGIELELPR